MITVTKSPQKYTTLNLARFTVISDRSTIIQFKVSVIDSNSGNVMTVQKYATIPMIDNGTNFDLAPLLSAFVQTDIINNGLSLEFPTKIFKKYRIIITEFYLDVDGKQVQGDEITTDDFYIVNALLNRIEFNTFMYPKYVMGNGDNNSVFLSKRPQFSRISYGDNEFIYFMSTVNSIIRVTYFRRDGAIITVRDTVVTGSEIAYRLDISPIFLTQPFESPFNDVFTPPFNGFDGSNLTSHFTVQAFNVSNEPISEKKTYVLYDINCKKDRFQIFFTNNLGGLDSFAFEAFSQSLGSEKTFIKSNRYQYDSNGNYKDYFNGYFTPEEIIIGSKNTNSFSLISEVLNDEMSVYAKSLISSDSVFIKLYDGSFLPINIDRQDYVVERSKYNTQNKRMTIRFNISDVDIDLLKIT